MQTQVIPATKLCVGVSLWRCVYFNTPAGPADVSGDVDLEIVSPVNVGCLLPELLR